MADLLLNIIGSDGASAPLRAVGAGLQDLAKLALDCTKAFEEQARADRQLERYAKDLTPAFKAQAAAMQEQLGVSDDMVQTMQTMLLRFGEAPDQVEATTRALLDYSAATGEDAVSATRQLLTSVESGKTAFKDLGLVYDKTGRASADLAAITGALAGKLGGSAQAEADSVAGQARRAAAQIDEMKESVGQLISEFINKTGAIGTFTEAIKTLQLVLFGATEDSMLGIQQNLDLAKEKLREMRESPGLFWARFTQQEVDAQIAEVKRLEDAWAAADAKKRSVGGGSALPGLAGGDRLTQKGRSEAEKARDEQVKDLEDFFEKIAEVEDDAAKDAEKRGLEWEEAQVKASEDRDARLDREYLKKLARQERDAEAADKETGRQIARMELAQKRMQESQERENKKFEDAMTAAGVQIGMAFANAVATAMEQALNGEEVDGAAFALDILSTVLSVVGTVIGGAVGNAPGAAIGGMVGSLAGTGAKALYKAGKGKKRHDGGEIEAYHSGGWPGMSPDEEMAVLQRGEAVWSRQQVASAGGPAAVDAMRKGLGGGRGGGGVTIIQALDSRSMTEMFEGRGGRAMFNAQRSGRGQLAEMFSK